MPNVAFAASSCAPAASRQRRSARSTTLANLRPDFEGSAAGLAMRFSAASAPRCLEIGFGAGEVIGALAETNPRDRLPGDRGAPLGSGPAAVARRAVELDNLRVICHDAVEVLRDCIAGCSFDEILIFFPDPWHKKRHHKRRLIDARFVRRWPTSCAAAASCGWRRTGRRTPNRCSAVCNACGGSRP